MNGEKGALNKAARKWLLWGIPAAFALGTVLHFLYDWTDKSVLAGLISPVNESIWEHLKLPFWPLLLWWGAGYFFFGKRAGVTPARWFSACALSLWVSVLFIVVLHYTYEGAIGGETMLVDILGMLAGITLGQLLALRALNRAGIRGGSLALALAAIVLLAAALLAFTFVPPKIPLFRDAKSGAYGIYNEK